MFEQYEREVGQVFGAMLAAVSGHVASVMTSLSTPVDRLRQGSVQPATSAALGNTAMVISTARAEQQQRSADDQLLSADERSGRDWATYASAIASLCWDRQLTTTNCSQPVLPKCNKRAWRQSSQQVPVTKPTDATAVQAESGQRRQRAVVYGKLATKLTISAAQKVEEKPCTVWIMLVRTAHLSRWSLLFVVCR